MPESPNSFLKEWDEKNNKENKLPSNPKHKPLNLREQLDQASSDEMVQLEEDEIECDKPL